ncbi:MAG: cell division protein FtsQ/DivIB [Hyphomicrobiaceae bacterium]
MQKVAGEFGFGVRARKARPPRQPLTWRLRKRLLRLALPAASLLGVAVFIGLTDGARHLRATESLAPSLAATAEWLGVGIDQVAVTGHRFTPDGDIFDALDLTRQRFLFGFDGAAAREQIERLPWVERAEIVRTFPGRLDVRIVERKAFAVWSHDHREQLIDRSGRVLQAITPGAVRDLPRVEGEAAAAEAELVLTLVASYPPLAAKFASAERVGGRRWRIHTTNGTRIELPPDGAAMALAALGGDSALATLLQGREKVIDLRSRRAIAVRSAATRTAADTRRDPVALIEVEPAGGVR